MGMRSLADLRLGGCDFRASGWPDSLICAVTSNTIDTGSVSLVDSRRANQRVVRILSAIVPFLVRDNVGYIDLEPGVKTLRCWLAGL